MMDNRWLATWLRPVVGLITLVGVLALSACGGGGGTPATNPVVPPPSVGPGQNVLTVFPPSPVTIYARVPSVLTIQGGTAPFRLFSSDTTVLPVESSTAANTVSLVANPVSGTVPVNLTIQDNVGSTTSVLVLVNPEPLSSPPPLIALPPTLDAYAGIPTQIAVVGGVAPYRAFSSNSAILPVTQNVVGSTIPLLAAAVAVNTPVTITVIDSFGQVATVAVTVHAGPASPPPTLSVLPSTLEAYSGIPTQVTIVGGVAPYRAFSTNSSVLPVTQNVVGNTVPIVPGDVTTDTGVTLTIMDSFGQTVNVAVTVHPKLATPAPALVVLPTAADVYAGVQSQLTITGGVAPYHAYSTNSAVLPVTQDVPGNAVILLANPVAANTNVTVTVQDSVGQTVTVPVTVHAGPATLPQALVVLPTSLDVYAGIPSQVTVLGGVAPYRAFSSNPTVLPVTQNVSGNRIPLVAASVTANTTVLVTVLDSLSQTVVVSVTVHPALQTPAAPLVVLPTVVDVYPGITTRLTISGGLPPYRAFSTNTAVLPVTRNVSGRQVVLNANPVSAVTNVTVTVQDSVGQTVSVAVTVRPTPPVSAPPLVVLPASVTVTKGVPVTLTISGGLAPFKAYSTNPAVLPVTLDVTGNTVILIANGVSVDTNVTITIQDSAGQIVNVPVTVKADVATPPPPLTIFPSNSILFSGSPSTLTVNGGVPPYRAFSSNPGVLPVTQAVTGTLIPLLASNVSADTAVTITVLDSDNKTATATVTVRPAPLFNSLTVTPNRATCGTNAVCSGETAVAAVTVSTPGGGGIPNRQVRFDVVSGDYAIQSGSALLSSVVAVSDANGSAKVVLRAFVNAPTQVALIRATDLTSGNEVTANFIIAQFTNGEAILSVLPAAVTVTGPDENTCSSGVPVTYYIFGGTPPYRVVESLPTLVNLTGSPVTTNGGFFTATTIGCVDLETFIITDATGRTVTATLSSVVGSTGGGGGGGGGGTAANCAGFSPPNPNCPLVNPTALTLSACFPNTGSTATANVVGGTSAYNFALMPIGVTGISIASSNPGTGSLVATRLSGTASASATIRVTSGSLYVDVPVNVTNAATSCP